MVIKGGVVGVINIVFVIVLGYCFLVVLILLVSGLFGFVGYGLSLVLFVLVLCNLGIVCMGVYFLIVFFVGVVMLLLLFIELLSFLFWLVGVFMVVGVWLYISECYVYEYIYELMVYSYCYCYDEYY